MDFDLLETHYVFDDETNEQRVLVVAYDDDILEAEEYFTLYFPTLTTSKDVLLITETSPNSVRVTIQDDEGNHNVVKYHTVICIIFVRKYVTLDISMHIHTV